MIMMITIQLKITLHIITTDRYTDDDDYGKMMMKTMMMMMMD